MSENLFLFLVCEKCKKKKKSSLISYKPEGISAIVGSKRSAAMWWVMDSARPCCGFIYQPSITDMGQKT